MTGNLNNSDTVIKMQTWISKRQLEKKMQNVGLERTGRNETWIVDIDRKATRRSLSHRDQCTPTVLGTPSDLCSRKKKLVDGKEEYATGS